MTTQEIRFWRTWNPDELLMILRIALGVVFIIGGVRSPFPRILKPWQPR